MPNEHMEYLKVIVLKGETMPEALTDLRTAITDVVRADDGDDLGEAIDRLPIAFRALTAAMVSDGMLKITPEDE